MLDGGDVHWHKMKELTDKTSLKKFHGKDVGSILPNKESRVQYVKLVYARSHVFGFSIVTLQYSNTLTLQKLQ